MAYTQLDDLLIYENWGKYSSQDKIPVDKLITTGLVVTDPLYNGFMKEQGITIEMPYLEPIDDSEPHPASDDATDLLVPKKSTSGSDIAVKQIVTRAYSDAQLSRELSGADPIGNVVRRIEGAWTTDRQTRLIRSIYGMVASNIDNDDGDMCFDITAEDGEAITSANKINGSAVIDTLSTAGDKNLNISAVACHSVVHNTMQKEQMVDAIPNPETDIGFGTYMGKTIIVDNGLVATMYGSPSKPKYITVMFGRGVFGAGSGLRNIKATAIENSELAGGGAGITTLISRRGWVLHPYSWTYDASSLTDNKAPSWADLATGANWTRNGDRSLTRMAFLLTNG